MGPYVGYDFCQYRHCGLRLSPSKSRYTRQFWVKILLEESKLLRNLSFLTEVITLFLNRPISPSQVKSGFCESWKVNQTRQNKPGMSQPKVRSRGSEMYADRTSILEVERLFP